MAEYYLPAGTWTSVLTGEARQGGKWYREKHGYLSIPLYARENSILALGARDDEAVYDYADGVTLNVYALQDGATAQTVVYSPDNQAELHAQVSRQGGVYRIRLQGQKPCKVALINAGTPRSASCPYQLDGATPSYAQRATGRSSFPWNKQKTQPWAIAHGCVYACPKHNRSTFVRGGNLVKS